MERHGYLTLRFTQYPWWVYGFVETDPDDSETPLLYITVLAGIS
jgi:hypothetical protein